MTIHGLASSSDLPVMYYFGSTAITLHLVRVQAVLKVIKPSIPAPSFFPAASQNRLIVVRSPAAALGKDRLYWQCLCASANARAKGTDAFKSVVNGRILLRHERSGRRLINVLVTRRNPLLGSVSFGWWLYCCPQCRRRDVLIDRLTYVSCRPWMLPEHLVRTSGLSL